MVLNNEVGKIRVTILENGRIIKSWFSEKTIYELLDDIQEREFNTGKEYEFEIICPKKGILRSHPDEELKKDYGENKFPFLLSKENLIEIAIIFNEAYERVANLYAEKENIEQIKKSICLENALIRFARAIFPQSQQFRVFKDEDMTDWLMEIHDILLDDKDAYFSIELEEIERQLREKGSS